MAKIKSFAFVQKLYILNDLDQCLKRPEITKILGFTQALYYLYFNDFFFITGAGWKLIIIVI